jgi:hypothetical protein
MAPGAGWKVALGTTVSTCTRVVASPVAPSASYARMVTSASVSCISGHGIMMKLVGKVCQVDRSLALISNSTLTTSALRTGWIWFFTPMS